LEEELEATLNFLRKTTMSTTKPIPQVIVISNSKEEVEIKPQHVVEENSKLVPTLRFVEEGKLQQPIVEEQPQLFLVLRHVEEKELQQLVNNGKAFI
jgi:hypothetical protein